MLPRARARRDRTEPRERERDSRRRRGEKRRARRKKKGLHSHTHDFNIPPPPLPAPPRGVRGVHCYSVRTTSYLVGLVLASYHTTTHRIVFDTLDTQTTLISMLSSPISLTHTLSLEIKRTLNVVGSAEEPDVRFHSHSLLFSSYSLFLLLSYSLTPFSLLVSVFLSLSLYQNLRHSNQHILAIATAEELTSEMSAACDVKEKRKK